MPKVVAERADVLPVLAEVFREHGYDGASLSLISQATGLGRGSLYHFFPGGKEEMADAVLHDIDAWFRARVFKPLRTATDPHEGIALMMEAVEMYFRSGQRICLVGAFALGDARDRFADQVRDYFAAWTDALADALRRAGHHPPEATGLAEETVGAIQGALVLARALGDSGAFSRALARVRTRLAVQ